MDFYSPNFICDWIQLGIAITSLLFSTFASWYEGSAILDNPWEWEYSTPFSQLLYGEIQNANQISQLDHFVYAAKFQPTFPLIMVISGLYLILLNAV
nr:YjdJ family protein [Alkalihalobacterium chitinilyticum]